MARIPYPDPEALAPATRAFIAGRPLINVFRMWLHAESVAPAAATLGGVQLAALRLPPRTRELAILACAHLLDSRYEWDQHVPISAAVGVSDAERVAIAAGELDSPLLDAAERAALELVRGVLDGPRMPDDAFARVRRALSDREIVELIGLVGYYFTIARMTSTLDVESDAPGGTEVLDAGRRLAAG